MDLDSKLDFHPILKLPLALFVLSACSFAADSVVIRDVRVFDGERVIPKTTVVFAGGRIARLGTKADAPAGAQVIDGNGKTLLPGLINSHTHVGMSSTLEPLRKELLFGVTTLIDMAGDPKRLEELRREIRSGKEPLPEVISCGLRAQAPGGDAPAGMPSLQHAGEAAEYVAARLREGSDFLKVHYDDGKAWGLNWPTLPPETVKALIEASRRSGKLTVAHIGSYRGARLLVESGVNGLGHLFNDAMPAPDFGSLLARHHTFVVPTMTVLEGLAGLPDGGARLAKDQAIAPYLAAGDRSNLEHVFPPNARVKLEYARAAVAQLGAARVPVLVGTDAAMPGTAYGASMHREMELLVEAGLTPLEVLRGATSRAARAFRLEQRGRIAPGLPADLVLVSGDPLADIRATRQIVAVWKGGRMVDRDGYRQALAEREAFQGIPVEPAILGEYAGIYEFAPGFEFAVKLENGRLTGTVTGQRTRDLLATSPSEFRLRDTEAECRFVRDASGKVVEVIARQGGKEMRAKKTR